MTSLLRSIDLTRRYGRKDVVRGVSLEAKSGEVVGLLGPNGAGKDNHFFNGCWICPSHTGKSIFGRFGS